MKAKITDRRTEFRASQVACAVGISMPVLRQWHDRNGLLPSTLPGRRIQRRYALADAVAVLIVVALVERGHTISASIGIANTLRGELVEKAVAGFAPWVVVGLMGGRLEFRTMTISEEGALEVVDRFDGGIVTAIHLNTFVMKMVEKLWGSVQ